MIAAAFHAYFVVCLGVTARDHALLRGPALQLLGPHYMIGVPRNSYVVVNGPSFSCRGHEYGGKIGGHTLLMSLITTRVNGPGNEHSFWQVRCYSPSSHVA